MPDSIAASAPQPSRRTQRHLQMALEQLLQAKAECAQAGELTHIDDVRLKVTDAYLSLATIEIHLRTALHLPLTDNLPANCRTGQAHQVSP